MSIHEVEQDPFDADEFVERLAWRTMHPGGVGASQSELTDFDPIALHSAFEDTISGLKQMGVAMAQRVERMEGACKDQEKQHWTKVADLQKNNQAAFSHFHELDERINFVATKVVHLGDQLEGVNTPRTRAAEAQRLMKYFAEFMDDKPLQSEIFNDPFQVQPAAEVIQKLYLIAQELPSGPRFDKARDRILEKYEAIQKDLIDEFRNAHHNGDKRNMKRLAAILAQFKGFNQCIEAFLDECQKTAFKRPDIFEDIPPLCATTHTLIIDVFTQPEVVMGKLILSIYYGKLKDRMNVLLGDTSNLEEYLKNLYYFYTKAIDMSNHLSSYKVSSDAAFLSKTTKTIFARYLDSYVSLECKFLREKFNAILQRYYDCRGHEKKQIQSGGMHELRRDLQAMIGTKANLNLGPTIENYGGETFLSQEVAINILQESKLAFKRCEALSSRNELPSNASSVFDALFQYLCIEHIDYALELGLQAVPLADPRQQPQIYFFDLVGQANTIFHLFEKQFSDHLVPLISSSPKHSECLTKKREIIESMEIKLDMGLDRTISAMVGWVRFLLLTEQKPTDFKSEDDNALLLMFSPACGKVVKYINSQLPNMHLGLDGKNVDAVLTEFGIRLHKVIYEHLLKFQYNSMGAMLAICDVNEYRKCVKEFNIPLVTQLFDTLHSLCNLLVVVPDNLKHACTGEQLASIHKTVLLAFVQLRADYKSERIVNHFK